MWSKADFYSPWVFFSGVVWRVQWELLVDRAYRIPLSKKKKTDQWIQSDERSVLIRR